MNVEAERFSVAPMMGWTDRHCRYFMRQISARATLYTEMLTAEALLYGDCRRYLGFDPAEQPLVLQLGGNDPKKLRSAAERAREFGYRYLNLNVGCPSHKVKEGYFGACLMAEPERVAECAAAMAESSLSVSVKCRLGIDEMDIETGLDQFIDRVSAGGVSHFIVHARKAWLRGLSPKENRTLPPLDYHRVYRLKQRRPELNIVINGGVVDLDACSDHLTKVDGVMMGRAAYHNPYILAQVDRELYTEGRPAVSRFEIIQSFAPYVDAMLHAGAAMHHLTKHLAGLYHGQPLARVWRRNLAQIQHASDLISLAQEISEATETRRTCIGATRELDHVGTVAI